MVTEKDKIHILSLLKKESKCITRQELFKKMPLIKNYNWQEFYKTLDQFYIDKWVEPNFFEHPSPTKSIYNLSDEDYFKVSHIGISNLERLKKENYWIYQPDNIWKITNLIVGFILGVITWYITHPECR